MKNLRMIGQYQIVERLATGGAGEVYTGIDTKLGREVAIKFLRPELASDPSFVDRFLVEAKSHARLNHPNIATLYALPQEDDQLCMIMEFVRGRTVEQIIHERNGPLGTRESLAIIAQVADGLSYAHEQGVIHRDVKPSNLMVADTGRVKIMDFGIARVQGSARLTRSGSAIGTPLYMSPEQHRGLEGDERSDIYSLAIVLYELLAGAPPFKGTTDFELAKVHHELQPPPLIPRVPGVEHRLESAIMVALSKRPEQRFHSMRAFSDAAGATALRGDATTIIQSYTRAGEGQTASRAVPNRAPLHTVALALARSRAASFARRFKGLHPAVQGVSTGAFAVMVIGALWFLFHSEPGPAPMDPATQWSQTPDSQQQVIRSKVPPVDTNGPASNSARTLSDSKSQPLEETGCDNSLVNIGEPGCITHDRADPTKGHLRTPANEKLVPQPEGSNNQDGTKLTFAAFKAAFDQANYTDARTIAEKLYAAGDPAGAYGEGVLYVHGYGGVEEQPARARNLFYEAATAKSAFPMAMVKLGVMYHDGKGGEQNKRLARTWFEKAADLGDGEAMFNLGQMAWLNEAGLKHRDAVDLYRRAKDAGYLPAKQRLEETGASE
jgi:serine/threonine protein kinase